MTSASQFNITEYNCLTTVTGTEIHSVYRSLGMCLRDASRFAAALSYARGAYVQVIPITPGEKYREWWYAGAIWKQADVPPISGAAYEHSLVCISSSGARETEILEGGVLVSQSPSIS
jgi:hypothetical protein